jgi:uncharacterized membrane protein (UPF0127 family)
MFKVVDTTADTTVGESVQLADTSLTRMFGLLGRRGLDAGAGLWIRPSSGVHTVGMSFPIDVIGLNRQLQVVKLWRNLVPFRITSVSLKIHSVIELPAGTIAASQVRLGDQFAITQVAPSPAPNSQPSLSLS